MCDVIGLDIGTNCSKEVTFPLEARNNAGFKDFLSILRHTIATLNALKVGAPLSTW